MIPSLTGGRYNRRNGWRVRVENSSKWPPTMKRRNITAFEPVQV